MKNPVSELKRIRSDFAIFGIVFCILGFFAQTPATLATYDEECVGEGCSRGELQSLYDSYASECLSEGCSNEEMNETAGVSDRVCPMFSDFKQQGYTVEENHLDQFGC